MNELLYWMSVKHAGSAQAFRLKTAELDTAGSGRSLARIAEWNLTKLGHAEVAPAVSPEAWRVAPPVFAAGDYSAAHCRAVLCGARTPGLLARLTNAAGAGHIRISAQNQGPDVIVVLAATAAELEAIAAIAGISVQWDAPLAILSCVESPKSAILESATLPVGGWVVSQFSKLRLEWLPSTLKAASNARSGLFRFRSDYGTIHLVIKDGKAWSCDPAVGKYRILRPRNRALNYSSAERILSIRATCRPPALIERALVLCSGELPAFSGTWLRYPRVDYAVAHAAAVVLGQRLTE